MNRTLVQALLCATTALAPPWATTASAATVSANRPMLNATTQANYTAPKYLQRAGRIGALVSDNWAPTGAGDIAGFRATSTVAADGSGQYGSVQAAVNAASGSARVYIAVKPGTYRGTVCVPKGKPPITLYGTGSDPNQVVLVFNNAGPKPKGSTTAANPCHPGIGSTTYGTTGSATVTVAADQFHAKNLTFSNDYVEDTYGGSGQQAVALMTTGDRLVFDTVRVRGHQDSLYVSTGGYDVVARSYFRNAQVDGDVDFIFGRGTAVFDGCTVTYLTARRGNGGNHIARPPRPATPTASCSSTAASHTTGRRPTACRSAAAGTKACRAGRTVRASRPAARR